MSQDDKPYGKPIAPNQELRMYIRDEIISPLMPPVRKYDKVTDTWLKSRDHSLIDKLTEKHLAGVLALVKQGEV